jgi:hypothetical protein
MASRSAKKGKGSFGAKPPKANAMGGASNYVTKAAGLKRGGIVGGAGASTPFGGPSAVKRLDRPGRKRGGAVGADSSPMTSAHSVSGGSGGGHDEDGPPGFARGGPPKRRSAFPGKDLPTAGPPMSLPPSQPRARTSGERFPKGKLPPTSLGPDLD